MKVGESRGMTKDRSRRAKEEKRKLEEGRVEELQMRVGKGLMRGGKSK